MHATAMPTDGNILGSRADVLEGRNSWDASRPGC